VKTPLTSRQRELVVGSLLGDAYLMSTTAGWCFRVNHGLQQREYVDWKYEILANFVRTPPRSSGRCYYFRTVTHPEFAVYRQHFYAGRKVAPIELLDEQFTAFSLAVWLMDDGAAERKQLRLNTQSFSHEENEALRAFLYGLNLGFDVVSTVIRIGTACGLPPQVWSASAHWLGRIWFQACSTNSPRNDFSLRRGMDVIYSQERINLRRP
jgi:hypothetical protein